MQHMRVANVASPEVCIHETESTRVSTSVSSSLTGTLTGRGEQAGPISRVSTVRSREIVQVHTSLRFAVLISESISNHSRTWLPAIPIRTYSVIRGTDMPMPMETQCVPLNSNWAPGRPPKSAVEVLWRSFMRVLNIAQVDAQLALPTAPSSQIGSYSTGDTVALTDGDLAADRAGASASLNTSHMCKDTYSGAKKGSSGMSTTKPVSQTSCVAIHLSHQCTRGTQSDLRRSAGTP